MDAPAGSGVPDVYAAGAWTRFVASPLTVTAETDPDPRNTTDRFFPVVLTAATVDAGSARVYGDQYQMGTATVYCRAQVPPGGTVIMNAAADVATLTAFTQ